MSGDQCSVECDKITLECNEGTTECESGDDYVTCDGTRYLCPDPH